MPCMLLWNELTIRADGGVAACGAPFYREDDVGRLAPTAHGHMLADVWNGPRQRAGRALFSRREGAATVATSPRAEEHAASRTT